MRAAEARLVVDEQVSGDLLHLVHSLAALAARVVIRVTLAATTSTVMQSTIWPSLVTQISVLTSH